MNTQVWFWQRIVSTHMAGLAAALSNRGHEVTFVAEEEMSPDRAAQGWQTGSLGIGRLQLAPTPAAMRAIAQLADQNSIHFTQGLRANGPIADAQRELARRGLQHWVVTEMADVGLPPRSWIKQALYALQVHQWRGRLQGVLANGHATSAWLSHLGMPSEKIFPFTYFLPEPPPPHAHDAGPSGPFKFLFVGQLVTRKRLDLLIDAVAALGDSPVTLEVIGAGPLEEELRNRAQARLGSRCVWVGPKFMSDIPRHMRAADCLVLPSRFDGWGAVVSEALMVGTPAICSSACGAADVVRRSGAGGVFETGDLLSLVAELRKAIQRGRRTPDERTALATWAQCLGADAGAHYLARLLQYRSGLDEKPVAPWEAEPGPAAEERGAP